LLAKGDPLNKEERGLPNWGRSTKEGGGEISEKETDPLWGGEKGREVVGVGRNKVLPFVRRGRKNRGGTPKGLGKMLTGSPVGGRWGGKHPVERKREGKCKKILRFSPQKEKGKASTRNPKIQHRKKSCLKKKRRGRKDCGKYKNPSKKKAPRSSERNRH